VRLAAKLRRRIDQFIQRGRLRCIFRPSLSNRAQQPLVRFSRRGFPVMVFHALVGEDVSYPARRSEVLPAPDAPRTTTINT
jgi:hypothetical protein